MTPTVLVEKRQLSIGMAGSKHKRSSSSPESEGLDASPVHVDSEDSSAPKRKCISLNRGGFEGFDVPIEVFALSKLSSAERKSLEIKLRSEVDKIRVLQRKLMSASVNVRKLFNSGVKRPGSEIRPAQIAAPRGGTTSHLMLMKQCEGVLKKLMSHKNAWLFSTPVDVVKYNIPDYYDIIKHPMDLGTIKSKVASGAYASAWNFVADVRLTFTNAMTYNPPTNSVHLMAEGLSKFFETRWKPIEKKLVMAEESAQREEVKREPAPKPLPVPQPKKKRPPVMEDTSLVVMETIKPMMTAEERKNLGNRLADASADLPLYIIDFLRQCSGNTDSTGEDELEIDIDLLDDDMLFKLQKLLDRYIEEKKQGDYERADVCEVEVPNVSGLSNSSMLKVNDPMEEDVDIGGDDAPVTSYPPICIEKETQGRGSKCSVSSSSSESGSSSSDSDSGTSSGESHDKAGSPKENAKSEHVVEQEKSDVISSLDRTVSNLAIPDQDAQSKPESIGANLNSNPEGESERQASPEKLYRAALLRSRFADTIVKAREKLITQGVEKADPEKFRREREELERQQREEKAKILAEAKAVEEARKRAEAEAEAEAKRKRELEREAAREAARQELLEMEKTAVTNDAAMLRELEMLRNAPAENIGSSVDETSPDKNSPDGLPDFMRAGGGGCSNPLEQLGLFMKVDDDEEDEEEEYDNQPKVALPPPPSVDNNEEEKGEEKCGQVDDEEEGEIEID